MDGKYRSYIIYSSRLWYARDKYHLNDLQIMLAGCELCDTALADIVAERNQYGTAFAQHIMS